MSHTDFTTTIVVDQTPEEAFKAINNVRGWWSEEIIGSTDRLNEEFKYHFEDVHQCTMKVIELVPGKKVAWLVKENYFKFTKDKNEWIGNKIVFDITRQNGKTRITMTQFGLVPEYECYDICKNAWNTYMQKSLFNLITMGKGQPNGKDKPVTDDEKKLTAKGKPELK